MTFGRCCVCVVFMYDIATGAFCQLSTCVYPCINVSHRSGPVGRRFSNKKCRSFPLRARSRRVPWCLTPRRHGMGVWRQGPKITMILNKLTYSTIFIAEPVRNDILRLLIANERVSESLHKTKKKKQKAGNTKTYVRKESRAVFPT